MFSHVSTELAHGFAKAIGGVEPPKEKEITVTKSSPALSQENTAKRPETRKVAVIVGKGFNGVELQTVVNTLKREGGIHAEILSNTLGTVKGSDGVELAVDQTFLTADSVLFDAVYAVTGSEEDKSFYKKAVLFVYEAFSHFKPIGATQEGQKLLEVDEMKHSPGVIIEDEPQEFANQFIDAIASHRFWNRKVL